MQVPRSLTELLPCVARETARMSFPRSMSRGKRPIVLGHTKDALERYFVERFPMKSIWTSAASLANTYDRWHSLRVTEITDALSSNIQPPYEHPSVAAKFLNTFMHQLIKYEEARPLIPVLHLPLDRGIFEVLKNIESSALTGVRQWLKRSPYTLPYERHREIQVALRAFVRELNSRPKAAFRLRGPIELNWLWSYENAL